MMLSPEELQKRIDDLPGKKVTLSYIEERIKSVNYLNIYPRTFIICIITLDNGFQVIGESACADPANFSEEVGNTLAYKHAVSKLWPLFGFLLREAMFAEELNKKPERISLGDLTDAEIAAGRKAK